MIVAVLLLLELLVAATVVARRLQKRFRGPSASIAAFDATMAALDPGAARTRETGMSTTGRGTSTFGGAASCANVFALDDYRVRRRGRSVSRTYIGNRAVTPKS
jgi:hypothetical protein